MRPNLWRWVGIGMLVALGVAWLTEVWLTTRAPWRPWLDIQPPAVAVAPARRVTPPPARPNPAGAGATGGVVIVEHADGSAEQVNVGPGQTVIVGTDGSIHVVTGSGPAAIGKRRAQVEGVRAKEASEIQAKEAAIKAKMAAQQDMEAAQQKAMAMGQGAVRIDNVAPPDGQILNRPAPAVTNTDGPGQTPQPSTADGTESPDAAPSTVTTQP